jgi:hypothetical protein
VIIRIGSKIKYLRNGQPSEATVTYVFDELKPPRFEGDLIVSDENEWLYPGEGDKRIWGYTSDILEVIQY